MRPSIAHHLLRYRPSEILTVCQQFSLPQDREKTDEFLHELFDPLYTGAFLEKKVAEAEEAYPALVGVPQGATGFQIYVEGTNVDKHQPGILRTEVGYEDKYIKNAINNALSNKRNKEQMNMHPNMVAINFLLGKDWQMAFSEELLEKCTPKEGALGNIDALLYSATGIDEYLPKKEKSLLMAKASEHPFHNLFQHWKDEVCEN